MLLLPNVTYCVQVSNFLFSLFSRVVDEGRRKGQNHCVIRYGLRYCPANSKRGRNYAHIIRAGKLEARQFFFLTFKGTPSQE
jgi:hypothetical protein